MPLISYNPYPVKPKPSPGYGPPSGGLMGNYDTPTTTQAYTGIPGMPGGTGRTAGQQTYPSNSSTESPAPVIPGMPGGTGRVASWQAPGAGDSTGPAPVIPGMPGGTGRTAGRPNPMGNEPAGLPNPMGNEPALDANDPDVITDRTTGKLRRLTPVEISDRARSQGGAISAGESLQAAQNQGAANEQAGAAAMNTASNAAALPASIPMPAYEPQSMPTIQAPSAGSLNMPYGTWDNAQAYANPYALNIPGYGQSNAITGQQATMDNIRPYLNPFLDQILANGTNQIEHSGASRGLFGSTGNINDIGTWATDASSKAYGDAMNAFNADRGYFNNQDWSRYGAGVNAGNQAMQNFNNDRGFMADQYWNNRNADSADYWKTYGANWDQYKYGDSAYRGLLGDYYDQNSGIAGQGQHGANNTGALYASLANALAGIYGDKGNAAAAGSIAGSNANRGMIGGILGAIFGG